MRTAFVILSNLNNLGGVERESIAIIEALKERGYKVVLWTTDQTDWQKLQETFGELKFKPDEERSLLPAKSNMFESYQRLLAELSIKKWRSEADVVINDHADLIPICSDLAHIQDPVFATQRQITAFFSQYRRNPFKGAYFAGYTYLHNKIIRKTLLKSKVLMVDGPYVRDAARKWIGRECWVIFPPADVEKYSCKDNMEDRENIVVSCGRFAPGKNQRIIPIIASKVPEAEFCIIGTVSASNRKTSLMIVNQIKEDIEKLNLKNVKILENLPLAEQLGLYKRAKVFLHTMVGEHFGMAVVEAMASGLVPVVHKSGGPWLDILLEGKYGSGYENVEEAAEKIKWIISDESVYQKLSSLALRRAKDFSKEKFKNNLMKVIDMLQAA
jgi:glycosyltransferase involved in cell wall biosynthesis